MKLENIFAFIDYLHSNIDRLEKYNDDYFELQQIKSKVSGTNLKNRQSIIDEFNIKFNYINKNIIEPIFKEAVNLNICDPNQIETIFLRNKKIIDNLNYKNNIDDYEKVKHYKNMYLDVYYRINYQYELKTFFDSFLNLLNEIKEPQSSNQSKNDNNHNENWFKVGLLFATGEIQEFRNKNKELNYREITEHFFKNEDLKAEKKYRPYISATLGANKNDKNIYRKQSKMKIIKEHCLKYDIQMCGEFEEKIKDLKLD